MSGQILIVESSTDNTPKIVLEHGGEVLRTPKRGVGRAYIDAIPHVRGKWILMGDADLTYDSIQIGVLARVMHGLKPRFVERLQKIMTFDRGMIASAGLSVAGLVLLGNLTYHYLKRGLQLEAISQPAILGLLLVILGFQTFGFTLLMEVAKRVISKSRQ